MAKKFGKLLLLTAAVGTAAAAAYYYMQKKDSAMDTPDDEDYDDFSEDLDENAEASRNYVALNPEAKTDTPAGEDPGEEEKDTFTPLTEQVKKNEETVEEFFGEDDPAEGNAPVGNN
ncbi:MAG: hypothetical protein K2O97_07100 [Acetatifactor sp.]|nr:hypothetical protein [Acetatifactor sp.]